MIPLKILVLQEDYVVLTHSCIRICHVTFFGKWYDSENDTCCLLATAYELSYGLLIVVFLHYKGNDDPERGCYFIQATYNQDHISSIQINTNEANYIYGLESAAHVPNFCSEIYSPFS